jgi:hypothetical protein
MELAIINGTYRDGNKIQQKMNQILIPNQVNGTTLAQAVAAAAAAAAHNNGLRSPPNPLGQQLIISPRLAAAAAAAAVNSNTQQQQQQQQQQQHTLMNGAGQPSSHHHHHQLIASSTDPSTGGIIYTALPAIYSDHHAAAVALNAANLNASQALLDYPNGIEFSQAGSIKTQRYSTVSQATMRTHPYARVALS